MENLLYVNSVVNPSREARQKRRLFYCSEVRNGERRDLYAQDCSNDGFEKKAQNFSYPLALGCKPGEDSHMGLDSPLHNGF